MDDDSKVIITLRDVYEEQIHIRAMLAPIVDPEVGVIAKQKDHESRLRVLEMKVYAVPGVMTMLTAGGLAWSVFGSR